MRTHTLDSCPGCGTGTSTAVELDPDHELRRCSSCGLVYAPLYADPSEIYVDGYLDGDTDFGLDITEPRFQAFLDFAAGKRLDVIESVRPGPGALLDVGCGSGEVLAAAQRRGWRVAGAEPVESSAVTARDRGLDVRTAMLEESGLAERAWDVVTAFHVLEHLPDAPTFLRTVARWAKPGGIVVVEVPNWASHHRERHGARWPNLRPLEHVAHYDVSTLRAVFLRAGLEPVLVRTMGFLYPGQTLAEQLADLAHGRWWRTLAPLCHRETHGEESVRVPGPVVHRFLRTVQRAYDRRDRGQVVLAIGRIQP